MLLETGSSSVPRCGGGSTAVEHVHFVFCTQSGERGWADSSAGCGSHAMPIGFLLSAGIQQLLTCEGLVGFLQHANPCSFMRTFSPPSWARSQCKHSITCAIPEHFQQKRGETANRWDGTVHTSVMTSYPPYAPAFFTRYVNCSPMLLAYVPNALFSSDTFRFLDSFWAREGNRPHRHRKNNARAGAGCHRTSRSSSVMTLRGS